jgi:hypothetical protein
MDYFEQHEQLKELRRGTLCHFRVALRIRHIDISNGMGIAGIIAERSEGRPKSLSLMKLRDHPDISYKGFRSWPPMWVWRGGDRYTHAVGEVGVLKQVLPLTTDPCDRCFLIIEHDGQEYRGVLLVEDSRLCREVYRVLVEHCGEPIQQIAEIDLTYPR